jgi:hypothetical protein
VPIAESLVVHVPVTGAPPAVALSGTSFGCPLTTMLGPPAAVITPPVTGMLPSPMEMVPPLPLVPMMLDPELVPAPELAPDENPGPSDFAHAVAAAAAAAERMKKGSVRVSRHIANPSRPRKESDAIASANTYHVASHLQSQFLVYLRVLPAESLQLNHGAT